MPHAASPSAVPSTDGICWKIKPAISQLVRPTLSAISSNAGETAVAGFTGGTSIPSRNTGPSVDCSGFADGTGSEETEDGVSNKLPDSTHNKKAAFSIRFPRLDHTFKSADN